MWKMSSYTTGNWTVDSAVRSNIEAVEQIANVYDGALAASQGNYPVEITCVVRNGDAEISFFTRDFYKDGKITMDKEARIAYIRDKVTNRG